MRFDSADGRPIVMPFERREVRANAAVVPPAFSADGRWVYAFPREHDAVPVAERFSVQAALELEAKPTPTVALAPSTSSNPF